MLKCRLNQLEQVRYYRYCVDTNNVRPKHNSQVTWHTSFASPTDLLLLVLLVWQCSAQWLIRMKVDNRCIIIKVSPCPFLCVHALSLEPMHKDIRLNVKPSPPSMPVADPDIRLGGRIMWRIQTFGWGGANLICFPVSHVYFFIGRGDQSL